VKIVMGLGNPGRRYERTRHNLGFLVVDRIAKAEGIIVAVEDCQSLTGKWGSQGETVLMAKPQTFMNNSGEAAGCLLRRFRLSSADLVVIYDDLDLAFGRLRIRQRGSAAGHRGLRSILEHVADEGIVRVRVGIGRPAPGVDPTDHVLKPFAPEELNELDGIVSKACDAVRAILSKGPEWAMENFNKIQ
jgi:peptidyl-tRNA hydrolase, PTH1 family